MNRLEQFAGCEIYDNAAICLTCGHSHLIAKAEQVSPQPWLDWLAKHPGHDTFVVPYRLLPRLNGLRHNADVKTAYAATAAYTITLAALPFDANLLAGQESNGVINTTDRYLDELVSGFIATGTSPTTAKQIEVHVVGALNDTPTYLDVFDGADSAETITSLDVKNAICVPVAIMTTDGTSSRSYPFKPTGIRQLFGEGLPAAHVLFVTHNTGVNLHATAGNHVLNHTPVYATVI